MTKAFKTMMTGWLSDGPVCPSGQQCIHGITQDLVFTGPLDKHEQVKMKGSFMNVQTARDMMDFICIVRTAPQGASYTGGMWAIVPKTRVKGLGLGLDGVSWSPDVQVYIAGPHETQRALRAVAVNAEGSMALWDDVEEKVITLKISQVCVCGDKPQSGLEGKKETCRWSSKLTNLEGFNGITNPRWTEAVGVYATNDKVKTWESVGNFLS